MISLLRFPSWLRGRGQEPERWRSAGVDLRAARGRLEPGDHRMSYGVQLWCLVKATSQRTRRERLCCYL